MLHAKFHIYGVYPVSHFPRNGQNMDLLWQKHGLTWSFKIDLPESWSICTGLLHAKSHIAECILWPPLLEMDKICHFIAHTWSLHGPSIWFYLNHNWCAQECCMPNFTLMDVSCSPFSWKWPKYGPFTTKTWSSHGPSNCFFLNYNQCAQGCSMQISQFWVYPTVHFP